MFKSLKVNLMYKLTIQISLILILITGCSPEIKEGDDKSIALEEVEAIDELALENERIAKIKLLESNLKLDAENEKEEFEKSLINQAEKKASKAEAALLNAEAEQKRLDEQALLNSAKNRESDL